MYLLSSITSLAAWLTLQVWVWGASPPSGSATPPESTPLPRTLGPLPAEISRQLQRAMELAVKRLNERSACRELFSALGASGLDILSATIYTAPISTAEDEVCQQRNAAALTLVGGRRTILCSPAFSRLSRWQAAMILIHEALHHAGLSEYPLASDAPRSSEINQRVKVSCGL